MGMSDTVEVHCDRCENMIVCCHNRRRAWREIYAHHETVKQKGRPTMIFCGQSCKSRFLSDNPDWCKHGN